MTSRPVTSSIRGSFGGRAGSGVCVCVMCVCLRLCVHDPNGAPIIVRLREGETSREGSYGPPIFHHLRFLSIDCCDCPRSHVSLCVCVQCLRLLSILLMAISQVDKTITLSHLSFSLHINLCLSGRIFYPSTPPSHSVSSSSSSSSPPSSLCSLILLFHPTLPAVLPSSGQVRGG